ncbi:hypothetical protein BHE97_05455 [Aeromicrobium sp. PE09-221]|uniref:hypothetical protein n=1 Tax=Aeromicrobium sp. PE09-221 TaxID=1898043 RepID=UPI000B3EC1CB|nr:hypothetical protein [Aeromicrobium sp. PE09-221]OUZ11282.1 hypothetical protein BHE97_05455 [Aeromicrobium sp. PE09-221]
MRAATLAVATLMVLAGCALPGERDPDAPVVKHVLPDEEVDDVVREYRTVRGAAVDALDPQPLSTVETGSALAIDTGMFTIAEELEREEFAFDGAFTVEESYLPRFSRYPLWFATVVSDDATGRRQVQVFERGTASEPWLVTLTAEITEKTRLPGVGRSGDAARRVAPDDGTAMAGAPEDILASLAASLEDDEAEATWRDDPFVEQMAGALRANQQLDGVSFEQSWSTEPEVYALRTEDGGALVFGTLLRQNTFTVDGGLRVTWPENSPQRAFWPDGVVGTGSLRYAHQLVVYVPPDGSDEPPRTLGASGGVIDSSADPN